MLFPPLFVTELHLSMSTAGNEQQSLAREHSHTSISLDRGTLTHFSACLRAYHVSTLQFLQVTGNKPTEKDRPLSQLSSPPSGHLRSGRLKGKGLEQNHMLVYVGWFPMGHRQLFSSA